MHTNSDVHSKIIIKLQINSNFSRDFLLHLKTTINDSYRNREREREAHFRN